MNKRGTGVIGALFLYLFFIIIWFIWLGSWVAKVGQDLVTLNHLTGIEAFFFYNLNFVIFIGILLGTMFLMYAGNTTQ